MSSESPRRSFKSGFGIYLAIGGAVAGSAIAAVLAPVFVAIAVSVIGLFKTGLAGISAGLGVFLLTGLFFAFFTFAFSLIPNFLGMCAIMNAALSRKSGPLYYSRNKFLLAGAAYGLFILFLSVCFMGAYFNKGGIGALFKNLLFFWLIPAAAISGILNFKIAAVMMNSALHENPKVKIDGQ